jgi:lipopolysaccharide transport system ATP-binding protein
MMGCAIEVRDIAKRYVIGAAARHLSLIDALGDAAKRIRQGRPRTRDFWALKDISFDVAEGEAIALIGANGAGKSTMLKILSKITEPTSGTVRYRGTVGSLLEVGAGFHPQLSGRDNIFLSGALLGMRRHEIARKFDQIVDFSGIETHLDEPVKHYSSGMYVRLAFAVAAHLETDILLVDEVLAVGDAAFQQRCLGRMESVASEGRTVVFVSHNLTAVQTLCERALWISDGRLAEDGPASQVIGNYLAKLSGSTLRPGASASWDRPASQAALVRPLAARARVAEDESRPIDTSSDFFVEWEFEVLADGAIDQANIQFFDGNGLLLFDQAPWELPRAIDAGVYRTRCIIPGRLLNDGAYSVSFSFTRGGASILDLPRALMIDILDSGEARFGWFGKWPGVLRPDLEWTTERI